MIATATPKHPTASTRRARQSQLVTTANNATAPPTVELRTDTRQAALEALWVESNRPRQRNCRRVAAGQSSGFVEVHRSERGTYFTGLQTCGHASCPVCGPKIREAERVRLKAVVDGHLAAGGSVYLFMLSCSHGPLDRLSDLLNAMDAGRSKAIGGKGGSRWARDRKTYGIEGTAWFREETLGRNGWHPHYHGVLFTSSELADEEIHALQGRIYGRFMEGLGSKGRWSHSEFNAIQRVRSADAIPDYLTKQDTSSTVAAEMTRGDLKTGVGASPGSLIRQFAATGDVDLLTRFLEYEAACEGRRWRYTSPVLVKRYTESETASEEDLDGAEAEDLDAAAEEIGGVLVLRIELVAWAVLTRRHGSIARIRQLVHLGEIEAAREMADDALHEGRAAMNKRKDRPLWHRAEAARQQKGGGTLIHA